MMYVQSLTLEGCFHIYLLKVESFSVLIENPILRGRPMSMICDITTSLEANLGPKFKLSVMWKLEGSSAQTLRTDFSVKQESFVQQFNF